MKKNGKAKSSIVKVGLTQMACGSDPAGNFKNELRLVEQAAKGGAKIIDSSQIDKKSFVDVEKPVWDKFANTPELKALAQAIVETK